MSTTGTKRKAESQASGGEPKKPKMKKKLLDLAKSLVEGDDKKRILVKGAKELWQSALDGHGVTPQEFATLRHILDVYKFTKAARIYLDSLVTKHRSGTSMYQQIDGKRYDRSCLDLAAHLAKDELISKPDAEELWKDVLDGPGVTQCEADTIAFVMEKYKCSQGAKSYLKGKLKEWRGESSGMDVKTSASSTSAAATAMAVDSAATATTGGWHHAASTFTLAGRDPLAPLTFEMDVGAKAYGLFVDEKYCYSGDESGLVIKVDRNSGDMVGQYRLPKGVKCLVGDGGFLFAGCNNGSMYDLTSSRPRLVAELEGFSQVLWVDMHNGRMCASDASGNVAMLNCEGEVVWKKKSQGDTGWMVRVDANGVYHGHSSGITKYDLEGNEKWSVRTEEVLFGWHTEQYLYAGLVEPACFDGEIAKRLSRAGAKSGIIVASLMWNNRDDLDLHVYVNDEHIYYGARRSASGGELDVDANAGTITTEPVENIYWKGTPPAGKFRVVVVQYNNRTGDVKVPFEVHLKVGEEKKKFEGEFTRETNATPIQGTWGGVKKSIQAFEFTYRPVNDGTAQTNETTGKLPQRAVIKIDKTTGAIVKTYDAGNSIPSTATTPDAKKLYAAVPQAVKCFKESDAEVQWTLGIPRSAMSMQAMAGEKLYAVCGTKLICIDTSEEAVKKAKQGHAKAGRKLKRNTQMEETTAVGGEGDLEAAGSDAKGVRLHCIKQGSKLRVRPEAGQGSYDSSMNCQFPRNIRREGARFLVDDLVVAGGNYYRVVGEIRRL